MAVSEPAEVFDSMHPRMIGTAAQPQPRVQIRYAYHGPGEANTGLDHETGLLGIRRYRTAGPGRRNPLVPGVLPGRGLPVKMGCDGDAAA